MDEPFSGLDATLRAQVREDTLDILRQQRSAALIVTHDPEEAMFMADRILVMHEGCIVQAGTPAETYFSPASADVAGLFGLLNRITGKAEKGVVKTPLAEFEAAHIKDGSGVEVLIRPEGVLVQQERIVVAEKNEPCFAKVINARLLGHTSHLRLAVECHAGQNMVLQARVPGAFLPESGSQVQIGVDTAHTFVFPDTHCS